MKGHTPLQVATRKDKSSDASAFLAQARDAKMNELKDLTSRAADIASEVSAAALLALPLLALLRPYFVVLCSPVLCTHLLHFPVSTFYP